MFTACSVPVGIVRELGIFGAGDQQLFLAFPARWYWDPACHWYWDHSLSRIRCQLLNLGEARGCSLVALAQGAPLPRPAAFSGVTPGDTPAGVWSIGPTQRMRP
jgi:hypothetical protein